MLTTLVLLGVVLEQSIVSAFPHYAQAFAAQKDKRIAPVAPFPEYPGSPTHALFDKFDPGAQLVSVSGEHAFIAPGPNDIRGPCAGLNAAANHGYIPRNGIASFASINTGLWEAFGLDQTATQVLETATRFFDGDPITGNWSIGPASPRVATLGLIEETGICDYGHGKTEADASITRGDFLAPTENSNCASYPDFAQELLDLAVSMTGGNITPQVLAQHSYNRKQHSIATNPYYFSPAYGGVAFTFGAHMFAFQLLANHSAEYPRGFLTPEVFESFFSYSRDSQGKLVYKYGYERIPDNWYRRSQEDAWTAVDIAISTAQQCASYPTNCQVGGNTGTVNSFSGVDLGDISGGLVNSAEDLSDPQKMACFISQAIQADVPSFLDTAVEGLLLTEVLGLVKTLLPQSLQPYLTFGNCAGIPAGKSVFAYGAKYPGAKIQSSGPRATSQ